MTDNVRRARILKQIEIETGEAARLSAAAQHESMKEFVSRAVSDLDEAMVWLSVKDRTRESEDRWLSFVEAIIDLAASRIHIAREILDERGPHVMMSP